MKRYIVKLMMAAFVAVLTMGVSAQGLHSAYFLEGSVYRHQMNPAFMGERNYVSIPVLGNMNIGVQGNVGMSTFLYKTSAGSKYDLTTFMSPTVSAGDFLDGLHDKNKMNVNINMTILSFGFHKWGGFNTFDLNLRSNTSANLPYDLFHFMKSNMSESAASYNIKDLTVRSNNYVELALGHSRMIDDKLTVGGKLKFLLGGANANAYIREMNLTLNDNQWDVTLDGQLDASMKGASFTRKAEPVNGKYEIDDFDIDSPGLGGFGIGIDLGAVYKMDEFVDGLTLSASVLDLGFIKWNHTISASNGGLQSFSFKGFEDIVVDDDDDRNSLDNQWDRISDDLEDLYRFYDDGVKTSRTTALAATLNVGAEYALPYYKKLTFGFLSTTRFNKPFTSTEGRFYANIAPIKWFDASVNYGASTYGSSFGWILNFHPKGFNFFIGSDHMIFKVNPQFVPIHNLNANVNFGFNITFGKSKKEIYVKN